jgi:hypothetical protein
VHDQVVEGFHLDPRDLEGEEVLHGQACPPRTHIHPTPHTPHHIVTGMIRGTGLGGGGSSGTVVGQVLEQGVEGLRHLVVLVHLSDLVGWVRPEFFPDLPMGFPRVRVW